MTALSRIRKIMNKIMSHEYGIFSKVFTVALSIYGARSLYCYAHRKYKKYPPGPLGLPFFGSLFSCSDIAKYAAYLASNYGPITMIYIGMQPFVFLHDVDSINQVFKNENALDREGDRSLVFADMKPYELETDVVSQQHWIKKRKIFQSVMLPYLDSSFLNNVHNESLKHHVFESINKCIKDNKLWYPFDDVSYIQFHSIWNAAFGSYLPFKNEQKKLINMIQSILSDAATAQIVRCLQKILPSYFTKSLSINYNKMNKYLEEQIYRELNCDETIFDINNKKWNKHFSDNTKNKNKCIVARLLNFHRNNPTIYSTKNSIIADINLLFSAGVDTTTGTTEYGLTLLAKYGKQQEKIYNELHDVFGTDIFMENVKLKQVIHKLHYLRAFIHEVLRISCVAPTGVAHYNSKCDILLKLKNNRYCIPKQSVIISDIPSINKNDVYWYNKTNGKPMDLCLSAWLDENNHFKLNLNKDKMVTFSVGPRDCAGQHIALKNLYLIFAKFILKYKFNLTQKDKNIDIKQVYSFTFVIKPKIGLLVTQR